MSLLEAPATAAPPPTATARHYQASTAVLANPDRGFYHHTEYHAGPDPAAAVPLDVALLRRWRERESVTVVYRVYYLERFVRRPLDRVFLAQLAADLDTARAGGVKLVLRFAYSDSSGADATPAQVLTHIDQLAPVLGRGSDVVLALQAGFVGRWGEWYYSDHFADDIDRPWLVSEDAWASRMLVLRRLLVRLPPAMTVQVRYPEIKDRLRAADPVLVAARTVGVHDDCLGADSTDAGTFNRPDDRAWVARETEHALMGGETCRSNPPWSSWSNVRDDLAAHHWSFLNLDYQQDVLASWGVAGRAEAERRLGYRIRLVRSTCGCRVRAGSALPIRLVLRNDGYAAPSTAYTARLVLRSRSGTETRPLDLDIRRVAPGSSVTFDEDVAVPARAAAYRLYLELSPRAPSLAGRPEYAVQLASEGTWVPDRGWNDLEQRLTVVRRSGATRPGPARPAPR